MLLLGVVPADLLADTIAPNPPIILSVIHEKPLPPYTTAAGPRNPISCYF